jgi:hypothetical protein
VLPATLLAQDPDAAILRPQGQVTVNGITTPASWTLAMDDSVRTESSAGAQLDASGSSVVVGAETLFQFEGRELLLEHGSLFANSSRSLKVRVDCVSIWPAADTWTKFEVTDRDGRVHIFARQGDVNVEVGRSRISNVQKPGHAERVTLRQGEQTTWEEHCEAAPRSTSAPPGAQGPILNSTVAKYAGVAGIAGLTACVMLCRGDDPVSPSKP